MRMMRSCGHAGASRWDEVCRCPDPGSAPGLAPSAVRGSPQFIALHPDIFTLTEQEGPAREQYGAGWRFVRVTLPVLMFARYARKYSAEVSGSFKPRALLKSHESI